MREGKNKWRKCRMRRCNTDTFTQILLHTNAFTHGRFYTQRRVNISHTDALTHRRFYTHTQTVYTQTLLHTQAFTHRLLHTDALTHPRFYAQRLLRTQTLYTQKLLHTHTEAFTDRLFHPRGPNKIIFSSVFDGRTSFRA